MSIINCVQSLFRRAVAVPELVSDIPDAEWEKAGAAIEERAALEYRAPSEFAARFVEGRFVEVVDSAETSA